MNKVVKEMIDNKWKKDTSLSGLEKTILCMYIVMFIFSMAVAILEKNMPYLIIAVLWLDLFICEYFNKKNSKMDKVLMDSYKELNKAKNQLITSLFGELDKESRTMYLEDIKISKNFTKPGKKKLDRRFKYYEENKCFEVPIIVDERNTLEDGYTSYLIAKKYKLEKVRVQRRK